MKRQIDIIYIDNHLIIVNKPSGLLVQGDKSGDETLLEHLKRLVKSRYNKKGDVFLGLVHRLDRPVSGVIVFARTSKAAARLSEQIRQNRLRKTYRALVNGRAPHQATFTDYLARQNKRAIIATKSGGKFSELSFKRLHYHAGTSFVEIKLKTGRYHQIRAQFSSRGLPIVGDVKYGADHALARGEIALHAHALEFSHPVRNTIITAVSAGDALWDQYFGTQNHKE